MSIPAHALRAREARENYATHRFLKTGHFPDPTPMPSSAAVLRAKALEVRAAADGFLLSLESQNAQSLVDDPTPILKAAKGLQGTADALVAGVEVLVNAKKTRDDLVQGASRASSARAVAQLARKAYDAESRAMQQELEQHYGRKLADPDVPQDMRRTAHGTLVPASRVWSGDPTAHALREAVASENQHLANVFRVRYWNDGAKREAEEEAAAKAAAEAEARKSHLTKAQDALRKWWNQ